MTAHPSEPLGLRRGSIRAILAILIISAVIFAGIGFVAAGYLSGETAFTGLLGFGTSVTSLYFISRPTTPEPVAPQTVTEPAAGGTFS